MRCPRDEGVVEVAGLLRGIRPHFSLTAVKRGLLVVALAVLAAAGYVLVVPSTGEAIPVCNGTVQTNPTDCMLGDSGWTVTVPKNVGIEFKGLDLPITNTKREDIWFVKTYNVFDFSPVTLTFHPADPDKIRTDGGSQGSFFRMDEVVTNKTLSPFSAFQFRTLGPGNDPCSGFHPEIAHIHPDGTGAPNPTFGGPTQWDGLLPVQGRCPGMNHQNDGTDFLVVGGRTIGQNDMWNPLKIRLHESEKVTWSLTEQVVPEPSTFALAASGMFPFALGYLKRSRRAKRQPSTV